MHDCVLGGTRDSRQSKRQRVGVWHAQQQPRLHEHHSGQVRIGIVIRAPRRLNIFLVDDRGLLVEADRVVLGARHVMVCPASLTGRLSEALGSIASPGWNMRSGIRGLPSGWTLFSEVEVVALGEFKHVDLAPLVPTSWSHLTLQDGFRLPGRARWLAEAPPNLSISVLEGGAVDLTASLVLGEATAEDDQPAIDDDPLELESAEAPAPEPAATVLRRRVGNIARVEPRRHQPRTGRLRLRCASAWQR